MSYLYLAEDFFEGNVAAGKKMGTSSFGVDLIPIYIKSTPNDEEPQKIGRYTLSASGCFRLFKRDAHVDAALAKQEVVF